MSAKPLSTFDENMLIELAGLIENASHLRDAIMQGKAWPATISDSVRVIEQGVRRLDRLNWDRANARRKS